jgi:hypothetical protein
MSEARSRICIFPLNPHIAARMWATCWIVERPQSFPGCCAAPSARLRASSTRRQRVYARLRRAMPSRRGALLIRGPHLQVSIWVPACGVARPDDAEPVIGRAFARPVGIAARALHRVRDTSEIYSRCRQVICPSGGLSTGLSSPFCKNISLCSSGKSSTNSRHPVPHRGAFRDRHGRRARDAVDAAAFCARWDCRAGSLNS